MRKTYRTLLPNASLCLAFALALASAASAQQPGTAPKGGAQKGAPAIPGAGQPPPAAAVPGGQPPPAVAVPAATTAPALADRRLLFILDASGSMNQKLADGQTRFDAARAALGDLVDGLPGDTRIALRVYGHQSTTDKRDCNDTQLVLGFGSAAERKGEIRSRIAGLKALGYTPISETLKKSVEDFPTEQKGQRTIILVSDGRETCKADPCAVAKALADANIDVTIHTVGFGVDDAARQQLMCVAKHSRGQYYDARTRGDLRDKLAEAVRQPTPRPTPPPPPPRKVEMLPGVLTIKGLTKQAFPILDAATGEQTETITHSNRVDLPPGIYTVRFDNGDWGGVEIVAGKTTELIPALIRIPAPAGLLMVFDPETQEELLSVHQASVPALVLIPGRYDLRTIQGFELGLVDLKAGEPHVLAAGAARFRFPAGSPTNHILGVRITRLEGGHTATFAASIPDPDVSLPPGRYTIQEDKDGASPPVALEIKAGAYTEVDITRVGKPW